MNNPRLGIVGGGQLGRMIGEAAAPLGVDCTVVDPTPDCPASRVADQLTGTFDDSEAIDRMARTTDALTVEIELADPDALAAASERHDVPVHPTPDTLRTIRDKLVQTRTFADRGVPVPAFVPVTDAADLAEAVERFGRVMCKARTGGYDGRGNVPVGPDDDFAERLRAIGIEPDGPGGAVAERFVPFERELAVIGVRGDGETTVYPPTETIHEAEIMRETLVPARCSSAVADRAREVALDVVDVLDGRGVFGIELFETTDGEILVNEVAPRPHNSGHWSIEGADCSQFEQHVRAVLGFPLGSPEPRGVTATANLLGDTPPDERRPVVGFDVHDDRVIAADANEATESDETTNANEATEGDETTNANEATESDETATTEQTSGVRLTGVESVLASDAAFHWYGKHEVYRLRKTGHLTLARDGDANPERVLARVRELRDQLTFE